MPKVVAVTALTLVTIVLLGVVLLVFLRRLAWPAADSLTVLAWLLPLALFIEPVRNTLWLGQINIVLLALVSLDCLTEAPRWPRGVLVGLAAAVKLTPAAFVLYFLIRRDYRAAITAAACFAAVTGAGFLLAPGDSVRYWTSIVFETSRTGGLAYAGNQSIQAVLTRAGLDPLTTAGAAAWLALSALVFAAAWIGMKRAFAAAEDCWALSLNAFAALLISPISWSHHWVWCVPALLTLAVAGLRRQSRLALVAAFSGLVVFAAAPQWWFPSGSEQELRWPAWQQVIGASYVIFAVVVIGLSARGPSRPAIRSEVPTGAPEAQCRSPRPLRPPGSWRSGAARARAARRPVPGTRLRRIRAA